MEKTPEDLKREMMREAESMNIEELIAQINQTNTELGDPPLVQMSPDGSIKPAGGPTKDQQDKMGKHHDFLLANNSRYAELNAEGTIIDEEVQQRIGKLNIIGKEMHEIFHRDFKM